MNHKLNILGISGSIRKGSYNTATLEFLKEIAPKEVEMEVYIPKDLPMFSKDIEDPPPDVVVDFKNKIESADGIIFATPEHNFTISAVMKNAIEWGNRPWKDNSWMNKPAALTGASTSRFGTVRARNHMRQIFVDLSIVTFNWPQAYISNAADKFDDNGVLIDKRSRVHLKKLLSHFIKFIHELPDDEGLFTVKE